MRFSSVAALLPTVIANEQSLLAPPVSQLLSVPPLEYWERLASNENRTLCYITPGDKGADDGLVIADALNSDCHSKGLVVLPGSKYHMITNISTLGLDDVHIHLYGRLLWSTDINYWLSVSMPVGFQNQSTVWYFGGNNVIWDGHGTGTLDGNGQVWYDWARGRGNLPHRPMMINFRQLSNSVVKRMRFVQSQMWTMATTWSKNILFEDIYVNNTSSSSHGTLNTDGVDTIWSDNITFNRWDITCGDDSIALKGNSSNIFVYDSIFRGGQGFAIGSLGQYNGSWEYVDTFYAHNITMYNTKYAVYFKTWPGKQDGWPPNGGGGGLGQGRNIVLDTIQLHDIRRAPFWIWQCEHYEGHQGRDCDSSQFTFSDIAFRNVSGTTQPGITFAASLKCSASAGCRNITVTDFSVRSKGRHDILSDWLCSNVKDTTGFECKSLRAA